MRVMKVILILVVFALIIPLLYRIYLPGYRRITIYTEELKALEERIRALEEDNSRLREEIEALKNDPLYIEKIARKELGLVRPGEIIYKFGPAKSMP